MAPDSIISSNGLNVRMTAKSSTPPTNEMGAVIQALIGTWDSFAYNDLEQVPELQFPNSVRTYSAMRNDSQLDGLHCGATWPILRYKWMLDPNGCEKERVDRLAKDLGLPVKGDPPNKPKPRSKHRFVFRKHMTDAFLSLVYGFYFFEQVGYMDEGDGYWHLRKLAPRPPSTIDGILRASDGGLLAIRQNITAGQGINGV